MSISAIFGLINFMYITIICNDKLNQRLKKKRKKPNKSKSTENTSNQIYVHYILM